MSEYLAATTPIPTVLTNARVYLEGASQLGLATVELPSFEYMTEDVSGLGIGGELSMPVKGHFKSMSLKLTWNTVTTDLLPLCRLKGIISTSGGTFRTLMLPHISLLTGL